MREWRYCSAHSYIYPYTEVSCQLPAPAALSPGKAFPLLTQQKAACAPKPVWKLWKREKSVMGLVLEGITDFSQLSVVIAELILLL